jgi:hypothetical protein
MLEELSPTLSIVPVGDKTSDYVVATVRQNCRGKQTVSMSRASATGWNCSVLHARQRRRTPIKSFASAA